MQSIGTKEREREFKREITNAIQRRGLEKFTTTQRVQEREREGDRQRERDTHEFKRSIGREVKSTPEIRDQREFESSRELNTPPTPTLMVPLQLRRMLAGLRSR
jgi:hypothetical protein